MTRVLVADDDHLIAKLLKLELGQKGFDVVTAYNGNQALKIINSSVSVPDIVLLDINMPEMNGFDVLEKMKARKDTKDLPVIVISTRKHIEDLADSVKKGIIDYVTKPFTMDEIFTRLLKAHRKHRKGISSINLEKVSSQVMNCNQPPAPESKVVPIKKQVIYPEENDLSDILQPPPALVEKFNLLLVEDHEANKTSLMLPFVRLGYDVQVVSKQQYRSIREFIDKKIAGGLYNAIIVDVEPNADKAYELCKSFRQISDDAGLHQVIIALGNDNKQEIRDRWLKAGVNNYFQKPVPVRTGVDCIVNYVKRVII